MAAKQIAYDNDARGKILRGIQKLSRAVRVTHGPSGRVVVLEKSFGTPTVTKDGVTVAKEIELDDAYENMGAQMVKEVASKSSKDAGDGGRLGGDLLDHLGADVLVGLFQFDFLGDRDAVLGDGGGAE